MKSNNSSVFSSKPSFVPPKVLIRKENKDSEQKNIPDSAKNNSSSLGVDLTLIDPSELFAKMLGPLDLEGKKDGVERKVYLCDRINKVSMACKLCGKNFSKRYMLLTHAEKEHKIFDKSLLKKETYDVDMS